MLGRVDAPWLATDDAPELVRIRDYLQAGGLVVTTANDRHRFFRRLQERVRATLPGLERSPCRPDHPLRRGAPRHRGRVDTLASPLRTWIVAPHGVAFARRIDRPCRTTELLAACCVERFGVGVGVPHRAGGDEHPGRIEGTRAVVLDSDGWHPVEPSLRTRLLHGIDAVALERNLTVGELRWVDAEDRDAIEGLAVATDVVGPPSTVLVACHSAASAAVVADRWRAAGWTVEPPPASSEAVLAMLRSPTGGIALLLGPELLRDTLRSGRGPHRAIAGLTEILAANPPGTATGR